ncbi:MAG: hypothetical protein M3M95_05770 [Pseudomonadota bacterium]|nr:hypothetical protein [Pseudomonadota bacterium]
MSRTTLPYFLAAFSIGLGLAELLAPRSVVNLARMNGGLPTVRAFGAREIANGLAILAQPRKARWLWARVAGDGLDVATLATSWRMNRPDRTRLGIALGAVAGITALDIYAAARLSR